MFSLSLIKVGYYNTELQSQLVNTLSVIQKFAPHVLVFVRQVLRKVEQSARESVFKFQGETCIVEIKYNLYGCSSR